MKKIQLLWIIPLCIMIGALTYSIIDDSTDATIFEAMQSCYCEHYHLNQSWCIVQLEQKEMILETFRSVREK